MASESYDFGKGYSYKDGKFFYNGREYSKEEVAPGSFYGQILNKKLEEARRGVTKKMGEDIASQQQSLAEEFRSNLPKYTGLLQDQAKKTIQRNLAENISNLKQASSSRGFLKGSGTQRQQAEALAGAQSETMSKEADIKDALESQAKQFENQALATKMSLQGSANQATIDALRQNILDTQRQSEIWKALGGAVGTGIGAYYGAKK